MGYELHAHKPLVIVSFLLIIAAAGVFLWYVGMVTGPETEPLASPPQEEPPATLGEAIYEQSSNPVKGTLPDTVAPIANPIGGAYRNPFE